uniref:Gastrin/cholecystokinin peptide hormone domain-containing protein n=1 Tax=Oryzias latipes TaxID=8090 RepID=A0A3P9LS12_ORYLA
MSVKTALLFALLLVLLVSSSASPAKAEGGTGALAHKGAEPAGRMRAATRERRRAHLTEDEREMMTKQIVQALSEVMNSDCMSDRDYRGWLDFGRRDAE